MTTERVAILGASDKPDRYAHKALRLLKAHGCEVVPVHPALPEIYGIPVVKRLSEIEGPIDTVTVYLRPEVAEAVLPELVALHPGRVIFNPGTESAVLSEALAEAGIPSIDACTLVLLQTGQF